MMIMFQCCVILAMVACVSAVAGVVETIAGGGQPHKGKPGVCIDKDNSKDGIGDEARFNYPWGIAYNHFTNVVYVADCGCENSEHPTDKIRKIDLATQEVKTIAGSTQGFSDGFGPYAHFKHIAGLTIDPELEMLYIADSGNHRIRLIYLANNKVTTIAGLPAAGFVDQTTLSSQFNNPQSVALQRSGNGERILYVADTDNHAIRIIQLSSDDSGFVETLAGGTRGFKDGIKLEAHFYHPSDIVVDDIGKFMYISDHYNHAIRKLELATGKVTTLAGNGFGTKIGLDKRRKRAVLHYPEGLVYDPDYSLLYVCEFNSHDILVVTMEGLVRTLAGRKRGRRDGNGRVARFYHPSGLTFDRQRRTLFVSDQYNHLIRSVSGFGSKKKYDPDAVSGKKKKKKKYAPDAVNGKKKKYDPDAVNGKKVAINQKKIITNTNPYVNLHTYAGIAFAIILLYFIVKPCFRLCYKVRRGYRRVGIRTTRL